MKTIQDRAKKRQREIEKKRRDPRYAQVMGRLIFEKLLLGTQVASTRAHPTIEETLWVGEVEPRVLELLPALVLRRPKLFLNPTALPPDLAQVVKELRCGKATTPFRGVAPEKYEYWDRELGRKRRHLAISKTHRFREDDLAQIEVLRKRWDVGDTEVIRRALKLAVEA